MTDIETLYSRAILDNMHLIEEVEKDKVVKDYAFFGSLLLPELHYKLLI